MGGEALEYVEPKNMGYGRFRMKKQRPVKPRRRFDVFPPATIKTHQLRTRKGRFQAIRDLARGQEERRLNKIIGRRYANTRVCVSCEEVMRYNENLDIFFCAACKSMIPCRSQATVAWFTE